MMEKAKSGRQLEFAFASLADSIDGVADLGTVMCSIKPANISGREATIEKLLATVLTNIEQLRSELASSELDRIMTTTLADKLEVAAKALTQSFIEFLKNESTNGGHVLDRWIQLRDRLECTVRDLGLGHTTWFNEICERRYQYEQVIQCIANSE